MIPGKCTRPAGHHFDLDSGWCTNGCGWRDDGTSQYRRRPPDPVDVPDRTEPRHPR